MFLPKQLAMLVATLCTLTAAPFAGELPHKTDLQTAVRSAMANRRGTAIVLDVRWGKLLASYHLSSAARRAVLPGSSLKPFTLKALLESGAANAGTALICKRPLQIAGHKLDCTHPASPEPLGPAVALAYSCNSYFTSMALRITPAQLRDSLLREGLASVTGLAFDETGGVVALARTPEELQLQAVGAWGVHVTPLELAAAYRGLAVLAFQPQPQLAPLFEGLEQSVSYGMARSAQPAGAGKVAGKTGTALSENGSWTHGWFGGYAPAEAPKIVVLVFLEKGRGNDAATVAREIFAAWLTSATNTGTGESKP